MNSVEARAREYIDAGRFGEAAAVLETAATRYGPGVVPQLLLAWTLNRAERNVSALEWALLAVGNEPENPEAHWMHATVLCDLDRKDEAAQVLWKAIELAPDRGAYYMELASYRYEDEQYATTRELVEKALELSPEDVWVQHTAGRIFEYHFRHRRAQHHYERALELDPSNVEPRYDLASLLQTRGRISEGVRCVYETEPRAGDEELHDENYDAVVRRWAWRWYEWALRSALVLNVLDWIFPTPVRVGGVLAAVLVAVFAVQFARTLLGLPARCRRDLWGRGRRWHFVGAMARTVAVLAGISAVLMAEPGGLQHLGVLAVIVVGYADWYWMAVHRNPATSRAAR